MSETTIQSERETDLAAVNRLLKGFQQMQQMMRQFGKGRGIKGLPIDPAQLLGR